MESTVSKNNRFTSVGGKKLDLLDCRTAAFPESVQDNQTDRYQNGKIFAIAFLAHFQNSTNPGTEVKHMFV